MWYLFLRDNTSSLVLGAGHYMSDRHNTPFSYSQETGYSYHILRRHQSGACCEKAPVCAETSQGGTRKAGCELCRPRDSSGSGHPGLGSPSGEKNPWDPSPSHPSSPSQPSQPSTFLGFRRPSSCPRLPSPYLDPPPVRHGVPGSRGAPPSLAQAPAERGKRGAILERKARIETRVTRNTRRTRNTCHGGFQRHNRTIRA